MSDPLNPVAPVVAAEPEALVSAPVEPVEVVDLIAAAVRACPAVAALHGGRFGQTTTYLPGRRVAGVTVSPTEVVVGVVGCYPATVAEIAAEVRAVVGLLVAGVAVTVIIEDLALPGEPVPTAGDGPDIPRPAPESQPLPSAPAVPLEAGPALRHPTPGVRSVADPVPASPPLATPLASPEKELP